jgi:hypothetical protein
LHINSTMNWGYHWFSLKVGLICVPVSRHAVG